MRIAVLDTETTGMSETDEVCELAIVSWEQSRPDRDDRWSSLVRPSCPVSLEARAVHHIGDEQLAESWTFAEMMEHRGLPELGLLGKDHVRDDYTSQTVCVAAHNIEFDRRMIQQSCVVPLPERQICTWKCAMHLYPDAPSHSNQVLRYYLDVRVPLIKSLPPHRALPDAVVTAAILKHILASHEVDELIELTKRPVMLKTVRFGKYRGSRWEDMEDGYLNWILSKDFDEDVRHTARTLLERRRRPLLQPKRGA
jgi:exodeoxyribonuclease X